MQEISKLVDDSNSAKKSNGNYFTRFGSSSVNSGLLEYLWFNQMKEKKFSKKEAAENNQVDQTISRCKDISDRTAYHCSK
jgi:hypothetical protein